MDPLNVLAEFVPEIIAIAVLGGGCEPPIYYLGEGEAVGSRGWYRSKERL